MPTKLFLPNLLEFIFHSIVEKGFNYLYERLDRDEWQKVKTNGRAISFAENATLDDKIILMSKLGKGCAIIFWDKEKEKQKKVEDIIMCYVDTPESDLAKQIVKDKVFACRDIDFIKSLQTVSNVSMSKGYAINKKYTQIRENSLSLKSRTLTNKIDAERDLNWYVQTIQHGFDLEAILEGYKIDLLQFRILLYLHTSPNGARKESIARKVNRVNVTGCIQEMFEVNLVDFRNGDKEVVSIASYGVMVLMKIINTFP